MKLARPACAGGIIAGRLAAAAGNTPFIPELLGFYHGFLSVVTAAQPCGPQPDILRRDQDGRLPGPLTGRIQFFRLYSTVRRFLLFDA